MKKSFLTIVLSLITILFLVGTIYFGLKCKSLESKENCNNNVNTNGNVVSTNERKVIDLRKYNLIHANSSAFLSIDEGYIRYGRYDKTQNYIDIGFITDENEQKLTVQMILLYNDIKKSNEFQVLILSHDNKLYSLGLVNENLYFDNNTKLIAKRYNNKQVERTSINSELVCDSLYDIDERECVYSHDNVTFTFADKSQEIIAGWETLFSSSFDVY